MKLSFDITFPDLYATSGLAKVDAAFCTFLAEHHADLHHRFVAARLNPDALPEKERSNLLIEVAPHLDDFIGKLFCIEKELLALAEAHHELAPIYTCKRLFVQRTAMKKHKPEEAAGFDGASLRAQLEAKLGEPLTEASFSHHVNKWLETEAERADDLTVAAKYAAWAAHTPQGQQAHKVGVLFKNPKKLDFANLVPVETTVKDGVTVLKVAHLRQRHGFALTDQGGDLSYAMDHANYCIWCHNQGKDSCSKGMREKDGTFKKSPTDVTLNGCPLEEHISEMNVLKAQGVPVGALAIVTINNPMCAGTGHRICNDCMKSCIYQKQEPVDIPQVETRALKDVLNLPYGFEIYSLLTRWNPLNLERPLPRPDTGKKVLVVGMGPAGYTLAHHLMNDGHTVVGVDGLKIEPLPEQLTGLHPIKNIDDLREDLDKRVLAGFGGVAEYGITVRWDKNFLKIIRLLLERREQFALHGGVRFGGTLTIDQAFELGFDHIALCMGAGKPTMLDIPNGLARGVRAASDFLMALQLTGAAKADSIANLQIRLPVVVIGGGLTAIDTATESLAYYPVQVEKFLARYEILCAEKGETAVRAMWNQEETQIADEFLAHARVLRAERAKPKPNVHALLDSWGGVKLLYRKRLVDAPCYRLNHEEVEKALEEGIYFGEGYTPTAVEVDEWGAVQALRADVSREEERATNHEPRTTLSIPARTLLIAAGTSPNTVLAREFPEAVHLHGRYFRTVDEDGNPTEPERVAKPSVPRVLMDVRPDGRAVSFFGDLHPSFAGNVVKAMGSAKQGYPVVSKMLAKVASGQWLAAGKDSSVPLFSPTVHAVNRLTPTIVEVVVRAPLAARNFQPGQFYRLQNYEVHAKRATGEDSSVNSHPPPATTLSMEGLALTGAWVDRDEGLLGTIVLEMGGSSDLCAHLKPGEPVVLMGPTGAPTEIPEGETVALVGGGLGNAVLFSIGRACREAGSKVLYFAGYKKAIDRYKVEEIEAAADVVVWCCDEGPGFVPARPQDKTFVGNIVEAMRAYQDGNLGDMPILLSEVDRIIAIGSDRMMAAVAAARHGVLAPYLKKSHVAVGSINSPMQCMMKEICAQCLQEHIDPLTGEQSSVFSCFNQDQELDCVSWPNLNQRLRQNATQEKLTAQWIAYCRRVSA